MERVRIHEPVEHAGERSLSLANRSRSELALDFQGPDPRFGPGVVDLGNRSPTDVLIDGVEQTARAGRHSRDAAVRTDDCRDGAKGAFFRALQPRRKFAAFESNQGEFSGTLSLGLMVESAVDGFREPGVLDS